MANISYLLMLDFEAESKAAGAAGDYERKTTFDHCISMVNNLMHGEQPAIVLKRCKEIFTEEQTDQFAEPERTAALIDANLIIDLYADEYDLDLS